jgi:adenylate cyclase
MAFWNAPVDVSDHAGKAVQAALGMRETLTRLNEGDAFGFGDERQVGIGIGIHTGLACVGNMGAETRFNYSAVGDAVNIASRIESACKDISFDILVSEPTASLLSDCALLEAGALTLKGKSMRTKLFAVVGDAHVARSAEFVELQAVHKRLVDALRTRSTNSRKLVSVAKLKAQVAATGLLQEFYRQISRRAAHFVDEPADRADHADT